MRTNIVLDDKLIQEAFKYTRAKTKRELVDQALREFVENHRRRDLMDLFGQGGIRADYDYKQLRSGDA
jgi:Arc/MetJ family transcription regulator